MPLGDRIAEKRKKMGFSQEELGTRVGVTPAFVSQIEKGVRCPSYGLLQKIAHELNTPIEYLVGGDVTGGTDPLSKIIISSIRFLDSDKKRKIQEYIYFLTGTRKFYDVPFYDSPVEYARYILKLTNMNDPPINPAIVAESLGVRVMSSKEALQYEGILYQSGSEPFIILGNQANEQRRRFTIAMLLGHLIIPWHLKGVFYREKDKRSLEEEDQLGIEAREFAAALMIPPHLIRKDLISITPGLEGFEDLAYNRYGSSMLVIAQMYVQSHKKTSVIITSDKGRFTRVYSAGFPYKLVEKVGVGSFARSFIDNPPEGKEIRKGFVDGNVWLENPQTGLKLYEESLLDPNYGVTVTFLQIKR